MCPLQRLPSFPSRVILKSCVPLSFVCNAKKTAMYCNFWWYVTPSWQLNSVRPLAIIEGTQYTGHEQRMFLLSIFLYFKCACVVNDGLTMTLSCQCLTSCTWQLNKHSVGPNTCTGLSLWEPCRANIWNVSLEAMLLWWWHQHLGPI